MGFQVALVLKNPPVKAGNIRDLGLIPGLKDPLGKGMATHSSSLAWRIPRTEESGRLQSMELQRVRHDWVINSHIHTNTKPTIDKYTHKRKSNANTTCMYVFPRNTWGREEKKNLLKQTQNNKNNGSRNIHTDNYLQCKWNKYSKQKTEAAWMDIKTRPIIMLYTRHTSDLGTHTHWKWGDRKRYSMQIEIKRKLK